jgi:hypothetical protein
MVLKKNIASLVKENISKIYKNDNIIFNYPPEWEILDNGPISIMGEEWDGLDVVKLRKNDQKTLLMVINENSIMSLGNYIDSFLDIIESPYIMGKYTSLISKDYIEIAGVKGFKIEAVTILNDDSREEYILIIFIDNQIFHKILISTSAESILSESNMDNIRGDIGFIMNSLETFYSY